MSRQAALLLVGPTGAGKTPLGEWLAAHGLAGRRCHHFDFGAQLRAVAAGELDAGLSAAGLAVVQRVLAAGALLEDDTFYIAEAILARFRAARQVAATDLLIMNGLPRHVGQAAALTRYLAIGQVAVLHCAAEVVCERIRRDSGGDRAERDDDDLQRIAAKLVIFRQRTAPLVDFYAAAGARVVDLPIAVATQPPELAAALSG